MSYSRASFQPVRKDIRAEDLQAALPRLYCCSFLNRIVLPLDPADDRIAAPAWHVTIELVQKEVGFRGMGDYIEIRVERDSKNYTEITTRWATLSGVFVGDDMSFKTIYKNGFTEDTYTQHMEQCYPDRYKQLAFDRYVATMEGLKDCLEDWVDSLSIQRYEPRAA